MTPEQRQAEAEALYDRLNERLLEDQREGEAEGEQGEGGIGYTKEEPEGGK